jgi:hypothetical protein
VVAFASRWTSRPNGVVHSAHYWRKPRGPSSRMPASVSADPYRSQNSLDYHIDSGRFGACSATHPRLLGACNESGPRT